MTPAQPAPARAPRTKPRGLAGVVGGYIALGLVSSGLTAAGAAGLVWAGGTSLGALVPFGDIFSAVFGALLLVQTGCVVIELARVRAGGGRHVAVWAGGRELRDSALQQERRLLASVTELAVAADLPTPAVYVLDREDAIDSFNAGWSRNESVVMVTQGALERLLRDEVAGLVGHSLARIRYDDLHRDMVILALARALALPYDTGRKLVMPREGGRTAAAARLCGVFPLIVGYPGSLVAGLLMRAARPDSATRADAQAAKFALSEDGIGRALRKAWQQAKDGRFKFGDARARLLARRFAVVPDGARGLGALMARRLRHLYGHNVMPIPSERLRMDAAPAADAAVAAAVGGDGDGVPGVLARAARDHSVRVAQPDIAEAFPPTMQVPRGASSRLAVEAAQAHPLTRMSPTKKGGGEAQDRDALYRLSLLYGPLERRVALLALLVAPQDGSTTPGGGSAGRLALWRKQAASLHTADRILQDVTVLSQSARLPWFDELLARTAPASHQERSEVQEEAARLCEGGGGPNLLERLKLQWMRVRLGAAASHGPANKAPRHDDAIVDPHDLAAHQLVHVLSLTAVLASFAPADWRWEDAVLVEWQDRDDVPAPGLPDAERLADAIDSVRRLDWTARPRLVRLWAVAALRVAPAASWPPDFRDAFRLLCQCIDSPLPRDVAACYVDVEPSQARPRA